MLHFKTHTHTDGAPWVVFVHGAGGAISSWAYQVEAFKPYFNLLLLDLRDHGLSKDMKPSFDSYNFEIVCTDILEVVDYLRIDKASFVSLSLGSVILQRIAVKRPELVNKIVMAGGIFRATLKMRFFVHGGKFFDYILRKYQMLQLL